MEPPSAGGVADEARRPAQLDEPDDFILCLAKSVLAFVWGWFCLGVLSGGFVWGFCLGWALFGVGFVWGFGRNGGSWEERRRRRRRRRRGEWPALHSRGRPGALERPRPPSKPPRIVFIWCTRAWKWQGSFIRQVGGRASAQMGLDLGLKAALDPLDPQRRCFGLRLASRPPPHVPGGRREGLRGTEVFGIARVGRGRPEAPLRPPNPAP